MKTLFKPTLAIVSLLAAAGAQAGVISDTGNNAYWGSDATAMAT